MYGRKHLAMNTLALQRRPEERVLHAVIGFSEVHEGCEQRLLLKSGAVESRKEGQYATGAMATGHSVRGNPGPPQG